MWNAAARSVNREASHKPGGERGGGGAQRYKKGEANKMIWAFDGDEGVTHAIRPVQSQTTLRRAGQSLRPKQARAMRGRGIRRWNLVLWARLLASSFR
jgi:hypothetical protein